MWRWGISWAARVISTAALLSGCLAYDHRWVQEHQEKQRAAARLKPAKLERSGRGASKARTSHVRAYATRAYAAETLNWGARFDELLSDANAVLEPAFGLRLENGGTSLWQPATPEDELGDLLDELARHDRGDDVSWVVGFVKSTPQLVFDHHQLGVGRMLSKHLVMRASNDPRELTLLSNQYYGLNDAEKAKLHADRRRHRFVAVFLHELGHTLGAKHRLDDRSIMNPTYSHEQQAFDATTLGLLRITTATESAPQSLETQRAVRAYYEAHGTGWVASERDQMLKMLPAAAEKPSPPSSASAPAVGSASASPKTAAAPEADATPLPFDSMKKEDRVRYQSALEAEKRGQFREAFATLLPIVDTNRRVYEVQDLRCRLAQKQRFFAAVEEAHCAPRALLKGPASR